MSDDIQPLIDALIAIAGEPAVQGLTDLLEGVGEGAEQEWKRVIFTTAAELMDQHGIQGLQMAVDMVESLVKGKKTDMNLEGLSLRTASDLLAQFQNAEADRRNKAKAFLSQFSKTLGSLLSGILKGAL